MQGRLPEGDQGRGGGWGVSGRGEIGFQEKEQEVEENAKAKAARARTKAQKDSVVGKGKGKQWCPPSLQNREGKRYSMISSSPTFLQVLTIYIEAHSGRPDSRGQW